MSSKRDTPDTSDSGIAPIFWGLLVFAGLAMFLFNFGVKVLEPAAELYPKATISDLSGTLFTIAILGGGGVVLIVGIIIVLHSKPRRDEATPLLPGYGKYTLTFFATGVTFLLITSMFMGVQTLALTDEAEDPLDQFDTERELNVDVTAAQFVWDFDVDDGLDVERDRMVLPADTVIHYRTQSEDVIHSFKILELGTMKDAMPGTTNHAWFYVGEVEGEEEVITRTGLRLDADLYHVTCAELCGEAHSEMIGEVYVLSPEDYEAYVEAEGGELPDSFTGGGD